LRTCWRLGTGSAIGAFASAPSEPIDMDQGAWTMAAIAIYEDDVHGRRAGLCVRLKIARCKSATMPCKDDQRRCRCRGTGAVISASPISTSAAWCAGFSRHDAGQDEEPRRDGPRLRAADRPPARSRTTEQSQGRASGTGLYWLICLRPDRPLLEFFSVWEPDGHHSGLMKSTRLM